MPIGVQPAAVESIVRVVEEHGGTVVRTHSALHMIVPLAIETVSAPTRIAMADVTKHGAPSVAWVQARARRGEIEIAGPRGARTVDAAELAALLAKTTIARTKTGQRSALGSNPGIPTTDVVADLATRRARRAS